MMICDIHSVKGKRLSLTSLLATLAKKLRSSANVGFLSLPSASGNLHITHTTFTLTCPSMVNPNIRQIQIEGFK